MDTRLLLVHFSGHLRVFDCLTLSTLVDTARVLLLRFCPLLWTLGYYLSTLVDITDYRQAAGGKICALHIFFYASGAEALAY